MLTYVNCYCRWWWRSEIAEPEQCMKQTFQTISEDLRQIRILFFKTPFPFFATCCFVICCLFQFSCWGLHDVSNIMINFSIQFVSQTFVDIKSWLVSWTSFSEQPFQESKWTPMLCVIYYLFWCTTTIWLESKWAIVIYICIITCTNDLIGLIWT